MLNRIQKQFPVFLVASALATLPPFYLKAEVEISSLQIANSTTSADNPTEAYPSPPEAPVKDTNDSDNQPSVTNNSPDTYPSPPEAPVKDTNNSDDQPSVTNNPTEAYPSPPEAPVKDTNNSDNQPSVTDNSLDTHQTSQMKLRNLDSTP